MPFISQTILYLERCRKAVLESQIWQGDIAQRSDRSKYSVRGTLNKQIQRVSELIFLIECETSLKLFKMLDWDAFVKCMHTFSSLSASPRDSNLSGHPWNS